MNLKIIYQDDVMMVIEKPAGLVVDRSDTQKGETLQDILENEYVKRGGPPASLCQSAADAALLAGEVMRAGIVHRLDKDTSGVMLVAKTQQSLESLQKQFQERKTKKEYIALVHGLVEKGGKVSGAVGRNPRDRSKFTVMEDDDGKEAETEYEPIEFRVMSEELMKKIFDGFNKIQMRKLLTQHYPLYTLVACRPYTGRTHQIRVHLKHIGFPIVGDEKYMGRKMYRLDKRWCPRQFLHAKKIGFFHPENGEWMEFEVGLPEDLTKVLTLLSS